MAALVTCRGTVRAANALASVVAYLRQTFWPAGLGVFYPHPALLGTRSPRRRSGRVAARGRRHRRRDGPCPPPAVPAGRLALVPRRLVPVLGLLQAGDQARADRFTYLPAMGLTVAVV